MTITAEFIYTEEEALRATVEVSKSVAPSVLVRLLGRLLVRSESRKRFKQNPNANKKVVWRFDEQEVEDSTDGASIAHWVPKKAFSSEADVVRLRGLIRNSGVKYSG